MKRFLLFFSLLLLLACSSDEFSLKQPTSISFKMDVNRVPTKAGKLSFNDGFLILSRFTFDGDRVQGGDNYFDRRFESGLKVPFDSDNGLFDLNFEVPQGNYSRIEVEFEIEYKSELADEVSLQVSGTYTNSDGSTYPIVLQLEELKFFGVNARNVNGGSEIILVADQMNSGTIVLNPVHWFSGVSTEDLDEASLENFEGQQTILINDSHNEDILDEVEDKIDELLDFVIF